MRKICALMLSVILMLSVAACGNSPAASSSASSGNANSELIDISGEITGEITVSAYDTMRSAPFLQDAARLFEEKYPGTSVNIETFSSMPEIKTSEQGGRTMSMVQMIDDPQGRQDYINKVSTEMMSGGGADVLSMDVLPLHKYAESGSLENLDEYMLSDADFDRSAFRENVFDALKYRGNTWFLPASYSFEYFAYDNTLIGDDKFGISSAFSTEQLFELAKTAHNGSTQLFNQPAYQEMAGSGMWRSLLEENYLQFVDIENKKANFNDGTFAQLLNSVVEYSEQGYLPKSSGAPNANMMMQAGNNSGERFYFKANSAFTLMNQFTRNSGRRMNIATAGSVRAIDTDDDIAGICANTDGSVPFTYEQAYGINSGSKNKQTAWAFIKFLLDEDMQMNTNLSPAFQPVRNSSRPQKAESMFTGAFMGQPGQPLDDNQKLALTEYTKTVEALSDLISCYNWNDTVVDDMISSEVKYFFDGSKTADEVAATLQNKVELYLSE